MPQPLPIEILFGIYLGVLTGMFPALVSWGLGFLFKYVTGVSIPAFGVVVLALALAGINGGLLALNDPAVLASGYRVVIALIVVLMLSLYAHAKGDAMGSAVPKRLSLKQIRDRTLASDVVERVGSRGEVRIGVVGEVVDMEGYPPLSDDLRTEIKASEWRLPADLPISELETRFAERLRTELDLADVSVDIDERGRATVVAAPPLSGISKRVPAGERAVSLDVFVPTGLARGDQVTTFAGDREIPGTVIAAKSSLKREKRTAADGGTSTEEAVPSTAAPTVTGGEGRVTVAVDRTRVGELLGAGRTKIIVRARGTRREFELVSMLRQAGKRFRKMTVRSGSEIAGATIGSVDVRETHVAILAIKRPDGFLVAPRGSTELHVGDELFVVGKRDQLDAFEEVVA